MLQLPFRQLYVLPAPYVNDYAWKPEHEICERDHNLLLGSLLLMENSLEHRSSGTRVRQGCHLSPKTSLNALSYRMQWQMDTTRIYDT